jgi:hypothetical protein
LTLTTEHMPGLASETIGIWVAAGSRDETAETAGSTHFLEHMLFKGTGSRDAKTIAAAFDRTGGDSNAITAKELTCYYSRCLVTDLPNITGLLVDMVSNSQLDVEEFERERGVIIEELAMSADDPGDVLFDDFDSLVFGSHSLARPVGATKDQIRVLGHHTVIDHYQSTYIPPRLVIAAAGGATHEEVLAMVEDALAEAGLGSRADVWSGAGAGDAASVAKGSHLGAAPHVCVRNSTRERRIPSRTSNSWGFMLGCEGLEEGHEDRFIYSVMLTMLGGGMSSQAVPECARGAWDWPMPSTAWPASSPTRERSASTPDARPRTHRPSSIWPLSGMGSAGAGGSEPVRTRRDRLPAVGVDGARARVLGGADEPSGPVGDLRSAARIADGSHRTRPFGHGRGCQRDGRTAAVTAQGSGLGRTGRRGRTALSAWLRSGLRPSSAGCPSAGT